MRFEETTKIQYFKEKITDPFLASVESAILVDCTKFQDFESIMWLYVTYKRSQEAEAPA